MSRVEDPLTTKPPSFEDVLEELGNAGRFQLTQIAIICSGMVLTSFTSMGFIFQGYTPPHKCKTVNTSEILPMHNITNDSSAISLHYGSCDVTVSLNDSGQIKDITKLSCPNGRNFSEAKHTTWISEWDLVCESKGLAEFTYSIFIIGQIVGIVMMSYTVDRFGRRKSFTLSVISLWISETAIIFAPNILVIAGLKFFSGFFTRTVDNTAYLYSMEFLTPKRRSAFGVISVLFWTFFCLVLGAASYITRDCNWKYLQVTMSVLGFLYLLSHLFLNESPRWLAANNRRKETEIVLKKASARNNKEFSLVKEKFEAYMDNTFPIKKDEALTPAKDIDVNERIVLLLSLFRNKHLRNNTIITAFLWVTNVLTYYGLYMTSSNLAGNRFLNFTLMVLVEVACTPVCFILMKYFGRRVIIFTGLGLTVISIMPSSLLITFGQNLPGSLPASTALFIFGLFSLGSSFCVLYLITPELYPTNLRSTSFGVCNIVSRLGSMVSPYMNLLFDIVKWGPNLIFTVMCLISMVLVWFLPETKDKDLPNTLEEMESERKKTRLKINQNDVI